MAKIAVKTRGDSSPQGKPRVWFCAHPEDYNALFPSVSAEILKHQNCAFFYDKRPTDTYDAKFLEDLSEMKLFVMPVTKRLLTTDNRALTVELACAAENHIRVLPLMQESGLEALFNEKCGDLQFLDRTQMDSTAIGYEEKLEKYLKEFLLGDELAEEIRAEFDAYIFLSYRKKDRQHAQKLMRLIHQNDLFRDVAIWYDEFLVPGLNFNHAIASAIKKSELFVMAATPNLINQINYVMTVEYPLAKKAKKKILPVEMVHTRQWWLKRLYRGIRSCVDPFDEEALYGALQSGLETISLRKKKTDPMHNYRIGLAYLFGIDVEADRERALSLIESAANDGLPEAAKKLVSMYREGEGVPRNYETAIHWQEKYVTLLEEHCEKNQTEETTKDYLNARFKLGQLLYELQSLKKAESAFRQTCSEAQAQKALLDPIWATRLISDSYDHLGHIARERRRWKEAYDYYSIGMTLCKTVMNEEDAQYRHDFAVSHERLGKVARLQGKQSEAWEHFSKSLDLCIAIEREKTTPEARRSVAIAHSDVGSIAESRGELDLAWQHHFKAFCLYESLEKEVGSLRSRQDLAIGYSNLGVVREAEGKLHEAIRYYRQAFEIRKDLDAEIETAETKEDLARSYNALGYSYRVLGDLDEAERYYAKSAELRRYLVEKLLTPVARRNLSISYNNLGYVAKLRGNRDEAQKHYENSLALIEAAMREDPLTELRDSLSGAYDQLGDLAMSRKNPNEAKSFYVKALKLRTALVKETGGVTARQSLCTGYTNLGFVAESTRQFHSAEKCYERVLSIREALDQEMQTPASRRALARSYNTLTNLFRIQKKLEDAEGWCQKCLQIRQALVNQTGTVSDRHDLASTWVLMGNLCATRGVRVRRMYYEKAFELYGSIAMETGTVNARRDLALAHERLGGTVGLKADYAQNKEAYNHYAESIHLREALVEDTGLEQDRRALANVYDAMGDFLLRSGWKEETGSRVKNMRFEPFTYFVEEHRIREQLAEETKSAQDRKALYANYVRMGDSKLEDFPHLALQDYKRALNLCEELVQGEEPLLTNRDLAHIHNRLGDAERRNKNLSAAMEHYTRTLMLYDALLQETNAVELRLLRMGCINSLIRIASENGDENEVAKYRALIGGSVPKDLREEQ